jgi:hypothetical protein
MAEFAGACAQGLRVIPCWPTVQVLSPNGKRLMLRIITCLLLLAPCLAAAQEPVERSYPARVSITAEGTVGSVELAEGVPEAVAALARDAAGKLVFEPAAVQGVPVASKTTVLVRLRFSPAEGGGLSIGLVSITPTTTVLSQPLYPSDALRARLSALVWLNVGLRPDGTVDGSTTGIESVDARHANGRKVNRSKDAQAFGDAALAAAAKWAADPVEVAGAAVATTMRVPVKFCMPLDSKACEPTDASVRLPRLEDTAANEDA